MSTRLRKLPTLLLYAAVVLFAGSSIYGLAPQVKHPASPAPTEVAVWIPDGAEVLPSARIHPGTFSVEWGVEEFKRQFSRGGLVSVPERCERAGGYWAVCTIAIWRERPGSTLFDKTLQVISVPQGWPAGY